MRAITLPDERVTWMSIFRRETDWPPLPEAFQFLAPVVAVVIHALVHFTK
jgi:hypothetical protein